MGTGGLGKSTLTVHAAHLLASQFPDGQFYANLLGATQPTDPAEVLARFLRDLGVDGSRIPLDTEERAAHFRTRVAGKRVLIVLDDALDAAQVRPLLPGSASAAALVTGRNRLPELMGSMVIDLDVLRAEEARTLFTGMVGERRTAAEPEAAGDVLAACAGLPLAIRIAGARLAARGSWTVRTLADRLSDERRRLDELRMGNLAVRASFEVSFASLPASDDSDGVDSARAFRLLGAWTGPSISLQAAAALIGEPEAPVADALDVLVDAHLLESPVYEQYRFHDLLRVYAAERGRTQEDEKERHAAVARVLTWYLHTAEAAGQVIAPQRRQVALEPPPESVHPLEFASLDDALNWCETERLGLLAATRLAASSGLHQIGWKLPAAAMSFYYRRSHWTDWLATHDSGLESARTLGHKAAEAWMLNNLGMAYGVQQMPEAVDCFEQALDIYHELPDPDEHGQAITAISLATAYFDLQRFNDALSAARRSLTIQMQTENRYLEGITLGVLGGSYRELRRFPESIEHLLQALKIFRELGDEDAEADSLNDLGDTYLRLEQVEEAIARFHESLTMRRAIGNTRGEAATLRRLGLALERAGRRDQARERLQEALRLFDELGDHSHASEVRTLLA
jgi:tetratricopeptide (TPR) repeat protein